MLVSKNIYCFVSEKDIRKDVDMAIIVNLDVMMARRKISLNELSARLDITPANLSILKTGKAKAIRFSTLEAICRELDCQPGDILAYEVDDELSK